MIFYERENYQYFLRELRRLLLPASDLIVYCLMPNHYHLLVQINTDDFSHSMQLLGISYTKAINKHYQRVGALFQGAFQSRHIARNEDLLNLSRYIHMNPVEASIVNFPQDWEFSSFLYYLGKRQRMILHPDVILGQFPSPQSYADFCLAEQLEEEKYMGGLGIDEGG